MSEEREERHAQDVTAGGPGGPSPPDVHRPVEDDLPPELKAIEAELASLSPRTDRLDRERLIFLAGQQSVAGGRISPTKRVRRWGWPAAFAAMTTVAASLLVALLVQGQPRVEVRIVRVPLPPAANGHVVPRPSAPVPPAVAPRVGPAPENSDPSPRPVATSGLLALVGLDWSQLYDRHSLNSETSYPSLRDRVLREGIDSLPAPFPGAIAKPAAGPLPYRKFLDEVLDTPASDEPAAKRPPLETLSYPGANS